MSLRSGLLISSVAVAILFSVGYALVVSLPGGGEFVEADFTEFYVEDESFGLPLLLLLVLLGGVWALIWFFTELRSRLGAGQLASVGYSAAVLGAAGVAIGGIVMFGPSAAQLNDGDYVGTPTAYLFAQTGHGVMLIVGMFSFAVAVLLFSIALRRSTLVPSWLAIAGMVFGVLLFASVIWMPGYLLPIWVLVVGIVASRRGVPEAAAVA